MRRKIKLSLVLSLYISFWVCSCSNHRDKTHHYSSFKICDSLFVEVYTISGGGAHGGDIMSHYVTDSVSFRKFIGVFDSANETFVYDCQDDSLLIKKYLNDGVNNKIIDERIVLIKDLKLKKELE